MNDSSATVTGLPKYRSHIASEITAYTFRVRAVNAAGVSDWSRRGRISRRWQAAEKLLGPVDIILGAATSVIITKNIEVDVT